MSTMAPDWLPAAVVAAFGAVLVAGLGGLATRTDGWYRSLRLPAWKPPDWAFGPIWTVILALSAAAGVLGWTASPAPSDRLLLLAAFGLNAVLNIAWSVVFFRLRRPDWALAELALLWLSILALALVLARVSLPAAGLILPYLAWVGVAGFLNLSIMRLNPRLVGQRQA